MTASERECRQQSEIISGLKSDKDSLETNLYETQQVNVQLDTRKEQLEGENQELLLKKENLMVSKGMYSKCCELFIQFIISL